MIVIGVDPGTRRTGYAVVDAAGDRVRFIGSGAICPAPGLPFHEKLKVVYEGIKEALAEHGPEEIAVEDVFVKANPRVALRMGHVRGVAMLAGALAGLRVAEYAPREIKQAVVGNGNASKEQVKFMVAALVGLERDLSEDESDALAVAITHVNRTREEGSAVDLLRKGNSR